MMNLNSEGYKKANKTQKSLFRLFFSVVLIFLLSACQDNSMVLVEEIYPGKDQHDLLTDTVRDIHTYTLGDQPLPAYNRPLSPLGSYYDPLFGKTTAGLVTQLTVSSKEVDEISNVSIDSVVLDVFSNNIYGDSLYPHDLRVYRLFKYFSYDSSFYSDFDPYDYKPEQVGEKKGFIVDQDSVVSLRLNNSVGEALFKVDSTDLLSQTDFAKFFNGLFLEVSPIEVDNPDEEKGSLLQLNLLDEKSELRVYYNDTNQFVFPINDNCAQVNVYSHAYENADIQPHLDDTTRLVEKTYLQGLGGVHTLLRFPALETLKQNLIDESKNITINRAQLVIEKADTVYSFIHDTPDNLMLYEHDDEGSMLPVSDYRMNESYFNGAFNADSNAYFFTITRFLQDYFSDPAASAKMILRPSRTTISPERVVLKGGNTEGVYLKLNYHTF